MTKKKLRLRNLLGFLLLLSLTAVAQQTGNPGDKTPTPKPNLRPTATPVTINPGDFEWVTINLECHISGGGFPALVVKNSTSQIIPAGNRIKWVVTTAKRGEYPLKTALAPGQSVEIFEPGFPYNAQPKAWYLSFKKK